MECRGLIKKGFSLFVAIGLISGCAGKGIKTAGSDPATLYREGLVRFNKRDYSEALKKFQELKANFPGSRPYALWAELKVGDCHFFMKEYVEAIAAYEEFKKIHPTHEEIPYVLYQIGMSHFNQMLSYDRDQTSTKKALSNFEYLVVNFPPSLFTEKAKEKIQICRDRLAAHEFYVAHYYYRQKNYRAASRRFQELLVNFPKISNEDEVLFLLGKSFLELNQADRAREALGRLVSDYPNSHRSTEAHRLLEEGMMEKEAKENPVEVEPGVFLFTKYEEEPRVSVPLRSPLTLPVRKINPHPRVELELPFIPEEEDRMIISPASESAPKIKGDQKSGFFLLQDEAKWKDQREPITIVSDQVEAHTKENRIVFRGSVIARQRDMVIYADSIEVITGKRTREIERVIARGNVKIQQGPRMATSESAVFHNPEGRVLLSGEPKVWEERNRISGEEIVFDIARNRVEVKGGPNQRGRATIYPDKGFEKLR